MGTGFHDSASPTIHGFPGEPFLQAILAGDRAEALVVARESLKHGIAYLYRDVIGAAMEQVGRLWEEDRISVADEHLATAVAESTLAALYPEFTWPIGGPRAIVACTEGERHQFGARMAADLLALDGWSVAFLGADVPSGSLVERVRGTEPVFVGLSICLTLHLASLQQAIAAVRRGRPEVRVLVGGRAASEISDPAAFGADACAPTAEEAVHVASVWKR